MSNPGDSLSSSSNKSNDNNAPLDQPWFKEAYKTAVEFYEKDRVLDPRDRLELSKIYVSVARAQLWGGWAGFATVFCTPFAYQYYKTKAIRGVKVPRNFVLGLMAMLGTTQLVGNRVYNSKLKALDPDGTFSSAGKYDDEQSGAKTGRQRQYEMMKLLKEGSAPRWAGYFYMTYTNPERRLPDPRQKLQQMKEGNFNQRSPFMNQRDPLGLYSGPKFDKKEGIPPVGENAQTQSVASDDGDIFDNNSSDNNAEQQALSSWDKVRQQNNVDGNSGSPTWSRIAAQNRNQQPPSGYVGEMVDTDGTDATEESQQEFDALLEKERHGEDDI